MDEGTAAKLHGLVTGSVDKTAFADADFVIEAVFEDLGVKKQVWAELEKIVSPEAVLATNTSSLSITEMAADLEHPERVVGFHFFNPVAVLPLLEIVRGERTDDATLATAFAVGKAAQEVVRAGQGRPGVRGQPAAHPLPRRRSSPPSTPAPRWTWPTARWTRWACRCARSPCSSWSGRPWRTTWAGPCTRRSRTGSGSARTSSGSPTSGQPIVVDDEINAEVAKLLVVGDQPLTGRAGPPERARRAGPGDPADARRGRGRRGAGHRPVHDPRRRLAVPPGRRHAVPGPDRHLASGSPAGGSCPAAWPACPPEAIRAPPYAVVGRPRGTRRPPLSFSDGSAPEQGQRRCGHRVRITRFAHPSWS